MEGCFFNERYNTDDSEFSVHILKLLREKLKTMPYDSLKMLGLLSMSRTVHICMEYSTNEKLEKLNEFGDALLDIYAYSNREDKNRQRVDKKFLDELDKIFQCCDAWFGADTHVYVAEYLDQGGLQTLIEYFTEFADVLEESDISMTRYAAIILAPLELIELYLDECDERNDTLILAELFQIEADIKFLSDGNFAAINCKERMEEYFEKNILS